MSKTPKKKSKKADERQVKQPTPQETPEAPQEDKAVDYGGLPNRDLKKNLGCG